LNITKLLITRKLDKSIKTGIKRVLKWQDKRLIATFKKRDVGWEII